LIRGNFTRVTSEIFRTPTVKRVAFEIKFPNLFYIEDKICDLQFKIMNEYPESQLLYRKQLLFADLGPKAKLEPLTEDVGKKGWVNITNNSLTIFSEYHKTYNLEGADKIRDIIEFILKNFF